jgi:hypothetical protein
MDNDDCVLDASTMQVEDGVVDDTDLANMVSALSHATNGDPTTALCQAMQEYVESTAQGGHWNWPPTDNQWPSASADFYLCGGAHAIVFEDVTYACEQLLPNTSTAPPGTLDIGFIGVALILVSAVLVGRKKKE